MSDPQDFLNPTSMLTPGVAGSLTMMINNALCHKFGLVGDAPGLLGLGLSFLCGVLVFVSGEVPVVKRAVYYVLNSLVIFVVAVGANTVASVAPGAERTAQVLASTRQLAEALLPSAQAQTPVPAPNPASRPTGQTGVTSPATTPPSPQSPPAAHATRSGGTPAGARPATGATPPGNPPQRDPFFRPWFGQRR